MHLARDRCEFVWRPYTVALIADGYQTTNGAESGTPAALPIALGCPRQPEVRSPKRMRVCTRNTLDRPRGYCVGSQGLTPVLTYFTVLPRG